MVSGGGVGVGGLVVGGGAINMWKKTLHTLTHPLPPYAARAIELFQALDINNDGVVTEEEFIDGEYIQ